MTRNFEPAPPPHMFSYGVPPWVYCPDGKPDRDLFRAVTSLSDKVILFGDFNSKHKVFNCAKTATSGSNLKGIVKELKLTYFNNADEHTHSDARHGTTDILDMAFVTPSLKSRDIRFRVGESLGSDHLPIEIFLDRPLQRNMPITSPRLLKLDCLLKLISTHSKTKWVKCLSQTFLIHLPLKLLTWMNTKNIWLTP